MATASLPHPWRIHFFQRPKIDDAKEAVPALDFFETVPEKVAAEINAILDAVADAPPPAFSGGGKWEAMHGEMAGLYEVRVQGSGSNHRVFCLLDRAGRRRSRWLVNRLPGGTNQAAPAGC